MSQIDMKELYSTINAKTLRRMELYDSVLKKCHSRILYNSGLQRTYCFYQIPEFIIGVPLYDVIELRQYIMNSLKTNGFELLYIEPNWLFVTWELKNKKIFSPKPKKKKNQGDYKLIDEYKPSDNLYNEYDMSNMRKKMNDLF